MSKKISKSREMVTELLKMVYDEKDVDAMQIWHGYEISTGQTGWHIQWAGTQGAQYIGANRREVADFVDEIFALQDE